MQKLSDTLRERGYVYQHSSETLEEITDGVSRTLYLGVDPTADSMHVGQLQGILVLRRFIEAGHKLVILVGGGTGMVGDPGGKSTERNLLSDEMVDSNAAALKKQFEQLLGGQKFEMDNNAKWLRSISMMEFLRDVGKHFTVNEMIKRDSVRPRIETPDQSISYTEFSYMLLQAYDYLHLNRTYGCDLQVGGSDQWGNIISGVDLIRRVEQKQAYAFSWPLLVDKKTGKKFGKSEAGTVWLDATKTSPFQFYQFWLNTDDDAVEELLLKMTMMPKEEIESLMAKQAEMPSARVAQRALAFAVTDLAHGTEVAQKSEKLTAIKFGDFSTLTRELADDLKKDADSRKVQVGQTVIDVLVESGLASSKREARQFVSDNAVQLNDTPVKESDVISETNLPLGVAFLKRGKRNVVVLKLD